MKKNDMIFIIIYSLLILVGGTLILSTSAWLTDYYNPSVVDISDPIIQELYGKSIIYFGIILLISGIVGLFFEKYKK